MAGEVYPTSRQLDLRLGSHRDLRQRSQAGGRTLVDPTSKGESAETHTGGVLWARSAGGARSGLIANLLLVAAAGTVAISAAVHLHLWSAGYRELPTIGPLFLFQAISGFLLSATLILTRRVWAAVLSFGFVCATIGGFLMAVYVGLFNFKDSWSAPFAGMAFTYEVASLALLAAGSALCVRCKRRSIRAVASSNERAGVSAAEKG
jgi:hypothetical protein